MIKLKTYRLYITPQTKVNIGDNERWIPTKEDAYLLQCGIKKRQEQINDGKKKVIPETFYVTRKRYMLKYLDYKKKLKEVAFKAGLFTFPSDHVWIKFFIPMPKSWTIKKRKEHSFEKHEGYPDRNNLEKAMEDALSLNDKKNWDCRSSKFWYDAPEGFIEVEVGSLPEATGYVRAMRDTELR